jgi:hypothetical protein
MTPRERIRELAGDMGEAAVAAWCAGLLAGSIRHDDPKRPSLEWVGGPHAVSLLRDHGADLGVHDYWPRVWGARGLLYAWAPSAETAILAGLRDPAWRVREMCAKVARRRAIRNAELVLEPLLDDPVARVREAADAALTASAR